MFNCLILEYLKTLISRSFATISSKFKVRKCTKGSNCWERSFLTSSIFDYIQFSIFSWQTTVTDERNDGFCMSCNIHLDVFSRLGVVVVGCAWPLKRNFDAFILSAQFLISRQASEQKAETHQEDQSLKFCHYKIKLLLTLKGRHCWSWINVFILSAQFLISMQASEQKAEMHQDNLNAQSVTKNSF